MKIKNISLSGARTHKPKIYFRAEIQKNFVCFLVQMKTVKFAFEISWSLYISYLASKEDPFVLLFQQPCKINEISLKNSFTFDRNNMNFLNDRNSLTLIFLYWEIKVKFTIACLKIKPSHEMLISFGNELFLELLEKSMWLRKYARGWFFKRE